MGLECLWLGKRLAASLTFVGPLRVVDQHVPLHVGLLVEGPTTYGACPGLLTRVCELMGSQVVFLKVYS